MPRYQLIYSDCPWWYSDRQKHRPETYQRMRPRELRAMGPALQRLAADDAALLLWATGPKMLEATHLFASWGFAYKTVAFVWCKSTNDGEGERNTQGHYSLPSSEYVLLGTRGSPAVCGHPKQVHREPPTEHSAKPPLFRNLAVEMFGPVPRLELFARGVLPPGWDAHGDQATYPTTTVQEVFRAY
jgi:site-specific DNA-methyltransferase (adenine-specific)